MKEKYDVIDLIIAVLREHEQVLDDLINRLDKVVRKLETSNSDVENLRRMYEPIKGLGR